MSVLALNRSNVLSAGIKQLYLGCVTGAGVVDATWHQFGALASTTTFLRNGKVNIRTATVDDSLAREMGWAYMLEASVDVMVTNKTNHLKVLDTISNNNIDLGIVTTSSFGGTPKVIVTNGLTPAYVSVSWKFVCDKGISSHRFVTYTFKRGLTQADYANLITTAPTWGTYGGAGTALTALDSLVRADIVPAGFKSVTCSAAGGNGATDNFGLIKNSSLVIESLTDGPEEYGRDPIYAAKVTVSFESMQTTYAETTQNDVIAKRENDWLITLIGDGTVVTLTSQLGVSFDYTNDKDSTGAAFTKWTGTGIVTSGALDAIFA